MSTEKGIYGTKIPNSGQIRILVTSATLWRYYDAEVASGLFMVALKFCFKKK